MYFTGAKFQSNNLKGTGDIVIFVLLCKIIHSFMHANMQIKNNYALSGIVYCFLTVRIHFSCSCL